MKNSFLSPYLRFIDSGNFFRKPFEWLYAAIAILNLIIPFYLVIEILDPELKDLEFKIKITICSIWAIVEFAGWVSFQIWWNRKNQVVNISSKDSEFIATPLFAHLIQTLGEWIGTYIAIVGFGAALISVLVLGKQYDSIPFPILGNYIGSKWINILIMPMYGFLIIVASRFLAEQIRALSAIANNTKQNQPNQ